MPLDLACRLRYGMGRHQTPTLAQSGYWLIGRNVWYQFTVHKHQIKLQAKLRNFKNLMLVHVKENTNTNTKETS